MSKFKGIARSAVVISLATLCSRLLGFVRDAVNAWLFGAGMVSDAFFAAFRIPNLLRDLLAEGSLTIAFIPTFTESQVKHGDKEALRMAAALFNILVAGFAVLIGLALIFTPWIVNLVVPGFTAEGRILTIKLTRIIFPFISFMSLAALLMGILNSYQRFFISAIAPAMLNIVMIASGFFLCPVFGPKTEQQVTGWTIGALAGGFAQFIIQMPGVLKIIREFGGIKEVFKQPIINFSYPGLKRIGRLVAPAVFSSSVNNLSALIVNTVIASLLGTAVVTYLYYGFRLMQLPLGVLSVSISTAAFPVISREAAMKDISAVRQTVVFSLKSIFFISFPATAGLIALSLPINNLLFHYGRFTADGISACAAATVFYSLGLFAFGSNKVLVPAFYALDDSRTPVMSALLVLVVSALMSVVLMVPMGFRGLALATSIASAVNFATLFLALRKRLGGLDGKKLLISAAKMILAASGMGIVCYFASGLFGDTLSLSFLRRLAQVSVVLLTGIFIYLIFSLLLKIEEAKMLLRYFVRLKE